jgi:D-beta-D-heptose 7-phosphate kinase/D-beta-D-heptose 1-phosphate adenosyltransferase
MKMDTAQLQNREEISPRARDKVKSREELRTIIAAFKRAGKKVVFTNGCFDLLHPGHIRYLETARRLGDMLVVAVNDDGSARRVKGKDRPFLNAKDRCEVIGALGCVDFVTSFGEDTPQAIIEELTPDVLVKGGDWAKHQIVGRETVEKDGGLVVATDFEKGFSTTDIVRRIRSRKVEETAG